jgi:hypothetical protein
MITGENKNKTGEVIKYKLIININLEDSFKKSNLS